MSTTVSREHLLAIIIKHDQDEQAGVLGEAFDDSLHVLALDVLRIIDRSFREYVEGGTSMNLELALEDISERISAEFIEAAPEDAQLVEAAAPAEPFVPRIVTARFTRSTEGPGVA